MFDTKRIPSFPLPNDINIAMASNRANYFSIGPTLFGEEVKLPKLTKKKPFTYDTSHLSVIFGVSLNWNSTFPSIFSVET